MATVIRKNFRQGVSMRRARERGQAKEGPEPASTVPGPLDGLLGMKGARSLGQLDETIVAAAFAASIARFRSGSA